MPPQRARPFTEWIVLLAIVVGATRGQAAGAWSFEGSRKLYPEEKLRLEDIPVPTIHPEQDVVLPPGVGQGPEIEIVSYEVVGATLLTPSEIREVLRPYTGPGRYMDDVQEARAALQGVYEERGFPTVAVTLPQQTLLDGRIRMEVIEARLGIVTIENPGLDWYSEGNVRRATPKLRGGAILRSEDLQEDVSRANRPRDRRVTPVLRPGAEAGTVDLDLQVDDRIPLHASLDWNNFHTPGTPEQRATLRVSYDNLWGLEHQIGGSFTFVPSTDGDEFDDVEVFTATYAAPMPWSERQRLFVYAAWSDTESVLPTNATIDSLGQGLTTGLRYNLGLPLFEGAPWLDHALLLGVDYKAIENTLNQGTFATIVTPIDYLPWTVSWVGTASGSQGFATLRTGVDFHFAGTVSGGDVEDFQNNRGGIRDDNTVDGTYRIYHADFGTGLRLPGLLTTLAQGRFVELPPPTVPFEDDWLVDFTIRGQYADEALVSTEQFPLGGRGSVRGYLEGERFGDHAWNMQLEVRSRALERFLGGFLNEKLQGFVFYDFGEWWLRSTEKGGGIDAEDRLASVGWGVRARLRENLRGEAYWGLPLLETENTGLSPRFQFQLLAEF